KEERASDNNGRLQWVIVGDEHPSISSLFEKPERLKSFNASTGKVTTRVVEGRKGDDTNGRLQWVVVAYNGSSWHQSWSGHQSREQCNSRRIQWVVVVTMTILSVVV
ncbi:hypothetical protein HAX54_017413, partial [Datura stramonium]|nr:hypothetical protein [Datura stramonium]